jgi:hypothetical protein
VATARPFGLRQPPGLGSAMRHGLPSVYVRVSSTDHLEPAGRRASGPVRSRGYLAGASAPPPPAMNAEHWQPVQGATWPSGKWKAAGHLKLTPAELSAGRNLKFTHSRDDLDESDTLVVKLQGGHLIEFHHRPPEAT